MLQYHHRQKGRYGMNENIIEVRELTKLYGAHRAVDGISFTAKRGGFFGFLGVNGAGKSTTINMLSTLIAPTSGSATVCGFELGRQDGEIRRRIGIVYQNNCLDEMLTVRENLLLRGAIYGESRAKRLENLARVSGILSLGDVANKRYKTLSGGQKRRCEIAAALMHTPELLFLDEPTTGLDPATRKSVWESVAQLRREGVTVFLTTHYMEEAAAADDIVILEGGRICAQGSPFELKERYARDKLRLYTERELVVQGLTRESYGYSMELTRTLDALAVLDRVRGDIDGFEVINGTMDDVFLNAAGKRLETGEDRA